MRLVIPWAGFNIDNDTGHVHSAYSFLHMLGDIVESISYACANAPRLLSFTYCKLSLPPSFSLQTPNNAPLVSSPIFTLQSLYSPKHHISPFLPKQKFAQPPSIWIFPISIPAGFQILIPSPQPLYTFPNTSHLMPSGAPVSA